MEILQEYVVAMVMALCLAVGYIIKHFLPTDSRWIPLAMGCLGVLINCWIHAWGFTPEILLGGLASGLASTGVHQIGKQLFKHRIEETTDEEPESEG